MKKNVIWMPAIVCIFLVIMTRLAYAHDPAGIGFFVFGYLYALLALPIGITIKYASFIRLFPFKSESNFFIIYLICSIFFAALAFGVFILMLSIRASLVKYEINVITWFACSFILLVFTVGAIETFVINKVHKTELAGSGFWKVIAVNAVSTGIIFLISYLIIY